MNLMNLHIFLMKIPYVKPRTQQLLSQPFMPDHQTKPVEQPKKPRTRPGRIDAQCRECGTTFKWKRTFKNHQKSLTACRRARARAGNIDSASKHLRSDDDIQCQTCGKMMKQRSLKTHQNSKTACYNAILTRKRKAAKKMKKMKKPKKRKLWTTCVWCERQNIHPPFQNSFLGILAPHMKECRAKFLRQKNMERAEAKDCPEIVVCVEFNLSQFHQFTL